jgi:hypothetical protein
MRNIPTATGKCLMRNDKQKKTLKTELNNIKMSKDIKKAQSY